MIRQKDGVRLTHTPTGTTAASRDCAPRRCHKHAWHTMWARKLLAARLCRPTPSPLIRRVYDLNPPLDLPQNIRQGEAWLAIGSNEVEAVLRGELERINVDGKWRMP